MRILIQVSNTYPSTQVEGTVSTHAPQLWHGRFTNGRWQSRTKAMWGPTHYLASFSTRGRDDVIKSTWYFRTLNSLPSDRTLGKANLNTCSVQMIGIRCADCWSYVCLLKKEVDQAFMANTTHPCSFMANTTHPCSRRIKRRTFTGLKNKTNQIPLITYLYSTTTSLTEHWCGVSCYKAFAFTWILLCLSLQLQASFCLQLHKVCDTWHDPDSSGQYKAEEKSVSDYATQSPS